MTYTPGLEQSPSANSPAARDGNLPQGLKSSPSIPNPNYPHLGFNPTPGDTETVRNLYNKLSSCAKVLEETHGLVTALMDGSYWKGDAAVAFREQLDGGPLPLNLKNAAHSIRKAARQLNGWEGELEDFQRRAKKLEQEAKDAQEAIDAAKGHATKAKDNPDLDGKGSRHGSAQKALSSANTAVEEAQAELDKILGKAKKLAEEHEEKARYRSSKIRDATEKLAPHEPGWLEEFSDWFTENLPDILSFTAGVIGLVALFVATGGTAAAVLLLAAAALSASALAMRISDTEVLASLEDGFTKGEFDSDFWGNAVSLGGDILGVVPGVAAVGMGVRGTMYALRTGEEAVTLGKIVTTLGSKTMSEAKAISDLGNPALDFVVRGARDSAKAGEIVEITSASLGVVTAGYGLASSAVDELENDGAGDSATGIDGIRSILDGGTLIDLAQHAF
ncbi:putative T7SS-secreted protein [Streptomyces sp. NPDC020996]|uniref:putative T7SS-secreted protein n=1 Tax=Streptomyces sp. NPDC020996 TaxID=3154791 RepID=UPI0033ECA70E